METGNTTKSIDNDCLESTISDVARRFGISLRTLRFYEDKGLLNPRREGSARFYNNADIIRIELILKGKRLGFTLAEITEQFAARTAAAARAGSSAYENPAIIEILGRARETFGSDEKAWRWFHRPTQAFSGSSPSDVSQAGASGVQRVIDLLRRIDHGLSA